MSKYVYSGKATTKLKAATGKARRKPARKTGFRALGGPWHGEKIFLSCGSTMPFTVYGWRGRYTNGSGQTIDWQDMS